MATSLVVPRIVAALMLAAWLWVAAVVITAPSPQPDPLLALTFLVPVVAAGVALARPPGPVATRIGRLFTVLSAAVTLLVAGLALDLAERLPVAPLLLPSEQTGYAAGAATFATVVLAALGTLGGRGSRGTAVARSAAVVVPALILTSLAGIAFGAAVSAGMTAAAAVGASAWGPTGPVGAIPRCDTVPELSPTATLEVDAVATIDGSRVGTATLRGGRDSADEWWSATLDSRFGAGTLAYERSGDVATLSVDGSPPAPVEPGIGVATPEATTVDGPILALSGDPTRPTAWEDLGVELVGGAPARRCRIAIDGDSVMRTSVMLRWLAAQDPTRPSTALEVWRGWLDRWTFADGQLGRAVIRLGGYPRDAWPSTGVAAWLEAEVRAVGRGTPPARPTTLLKP